MNEKKQKQPIGKLKVIIGSSSLMIVFLSPYLNITQYSISTNLLQNALYCLLFLSFWILATHLLRSHPAKQTTLSIATENKHKYSTIKTIVKASHS